MADNFKDMKGSFGSDIGNISTSSNDKLDQIDEKIDKLLEMVKPLVELKNDYVEPVKEETPSEELDKNEETFNNTFEAPEEQLDMVEAPVEETPAAEQPAVAPVESVQPEVTPLVSEIEEDKDFAAKVDAAVARLKEAKKAEAEKIEEPARELENVKVDKIEDNFLDIDSLLNEYSEQVENKAEKPTPVMESVASEPVVSAPVVEKPVSETKNSYVDVTQNYVGLTLPKNMVRVEAGKQRILSTQNNEKIQHESVELGQAEKTLVMSNAA